jgi:hypothetical protein
MRVKSVSPFVAQIWADADPAEGSSVWTDPVTGWCTRCRLAAVAWVRQNRAPLRHTWELA